MESVDGVITYISGSVELLDAIRPLWLKLNELHGTTSPHFSDTFEKATFADRREGLLKKAQGSQMRIDIARLEAREDPVAYCISSVDSQGVGEIDSIFVAEPYRGHGIARRLVDMSLAWMDGLGVVRKVVLVSYGNDEALGFYEKMGFYPANYQLLLKSSDQRRERSRPTT